jgi:hypothetical protein
VHKIEINSKNIITLQEEIINKLHENSSVDISEPDNEFLKATWDNMFSNFRLWHHEDQARCFDVVDAQIADVKRKIDKENQIRNDFIEKIDEVLLSILPALSDEEKESLPMNTETPGSVIDRLSIAGLKIFHMNEEALREDALAEHKEKCLNRLNMLKFQKIDLAAAFDALIEDLFNKKKQLRLYRQFKMYNDPELNPAVYKSVSRES